MLTSTPENYLIYDSLIGRLLHLDNPDYFSVLSKATSPDLEKLLKVERSALDQADEMLGLSARRVVTKASGASSVRRQ